MAQSNQENIPGIIKRNDLSFCCHIRSEVLCRICRKILTDACYGPCGCKYCFVCIREYLGDEKKLCPGEQDQCKMEPISLKGDIYSDRAMDLRISTFVVKCPNTLCNFTDKIKLIGNHLRVCGERSSMVLECLECADSNDEIKMNPVSELNPNAQFLMESINNLRTDIINLTNERTSMYKEIDTLKRSEQKRQMDESREVNQIGELQQNLIQLQLDQNMLQSDMMNTNNLLRQQIKVFESLIPKCKNSENELEELRRKMEEREVQLATTLTKISTTTTDLTLKVPKIDNLIKFLDNKISYLEEQSSRMEIKMKTENKFIWVIENLSGKIDQTSKRVCTEFFSDPFYSHKNGYKLCLLLDPLGSRSDSDKYLSIYFCLMRGPFDNILRWPFIHDVDISLINQRTGSIYTRKTRKFSHFPNDATWNKPTSERSTPIGYCHFINLTELLRNSELYFEDKIFITCTVDVDK